MSQIKIGLQVVGALAGLASLLGLAVSLFQISNVYEDELTKKWQSIIIYQHIEKAGETGLTFDQLKQKYLDSVQQFKDFKLPKDAPSDDSLTWMILDLITRRVINVLPGPIYKVNFEPAFVRDQTPEINKIGRAVEEKIGFFARTEPKRYTIDQMVDKVFADFPKISPNLIRQILQSGINQHFLEVDDVDNTIYLPYGSKPENGKYKKNRLN